MRFISLTGLLLCLASWVNASPTLGHLTVFDKKNKCHDIVYENRGGYAVVEDDIILTRLPKFIDSEPRPRAMILMQLGGFRWPQAIVPYRFAPSLARDKQLKILDAMDTWQKYTRIRFVEISEAEQDKYRDYLLFIPSEAKSCSSSVGRTGGVQVIMLGYDCKTAMNVAHELGHALGLWHEQSRNDRDKFIKIVWSNIQEDHLFNFNQHINDGEDFGDYDYQSIMHYPSTNFSKNGQETIVPLIPGVTIGQRDHLSAKDISAVNAMYP